MLILCCEIDNARFSRPARHDLYPCCVRPIAAHVVDDKSLHCECFLKCVIDNARFSRPARHDLYPCCVRPIAAHVVYGFSLWLKSFKGVFHGCDNAYVLYLWGRLVACYVELPLCGLSYVAELAVRVFGKLLRHSACIARRLFNHSGLDVIQRCVFKLWVIVVLVAYYLNILPRISPMSRRW